MSCQIEEMNSPAPKRKVNLITFVTEKHRSHSCVFLRKLRRNNRSL